MLSYNTRPLLCMKQPHEGHLNINKGRQEIDNLTTTCSNNNKKVRAQETLSYKNENKSTRNFNKQ